MINYKIVGFTQAWPMIKDLVAYQWDEVDHRKKESKLAVSEDIYTTLEEMGSHFLCIAVEDNKVYGFMSIIVEKSPHTGTLHAVTDTVFVSLDKRDTGIGTSLISVAEEEANKRGAKYFMISLKQGTKHEDLMEGLGYDLVEIMYSKHLEKRESL